MVEAPQLHPNLGTLQRDGGQSTGEGRFEAALACDGDPEAHPANDTVSAVFDSGAAGGEVIQHPRLCGRITRRRYALKNPTADSPCGERAPRGRQDRSRLARNADSKDGLERSRRGGGQAEKLRARFLAGADNGKDQAPSAVSNSRILEMHHHVGVERSPAPASPLRPLIAKRNSLKRRNHGRRVCPRTESCARRAISSGRPRGRAVRGARGLVDEARPEERTQNPVRRLRDPHSLPQMEGTAQHRPSFTGTTASCVPSETNIFNHKNNFWVNSAKRSASCQRGSRDRRCRGQHEPV